MVAAVHNMNSATAVPEQVQHPSLRLAVGVMAQVRLTFILNAVFAREMEKNKGTVQYVMEPER